MSMDRKRYPADWDAISQRIRFERAGGKCEQCGAPHGALIVRSSEEPERYLLIDEASGGYQQSDGTPIRLSEVPEEYADSKWVRVVLTTHHIGVQKPDGTPGDPRDKMDVRDENLIALCQRCHFIADLPIHIVNARRSRLEHRAERQAAQGQLNLFSEAVQDE